MSFDTGVTYKYHNDMLFDTHVHSKRHGQDFRSIVIHNCFVIEIEISYGEVYSKYLTQDTFYIYLLVNTVFVRMYSVVNKTER